MNTIRESIQERRKQLVQQIDLLERHLEKLDDEEAKVPSELMDIETEYTISTNVYHHTVTLIINGPVEAIWPFFNAAQSRFDIMGDQIEKPEMTKLEAFQDLSFFLYPEPGDGKYATELVARERFEPLSGEMILEEQVG